MYLFFSSIFFLLPPFLCLKIVYIVIHQKEGDCVNIDVTAPGATLALGMIYFRSNNKAIAEWMVAPSTPYLLDQVCFTSQCCEEKLLYIVCLFLRESPWDLL